MNMSTQKLTDSNILFQWEPSAFVEALETPNATKILRLSKGAGGTLYVLVREEKGKKLYNAVSFDERRVKDYLSVVVSRPKETLTFDEVRDTKRLTLLLDTLISEFGYGNLEINGEGLIGLRFGMKGLSFRDIKKKFLDISM